MTEEINFVNIDADNIYRETVSQLESAVGESLYPGDERRIFAEALSAVLVSLLASMNDKARQRLLRYARGNVLDAIGEMRHVTRLQAKPAVTTLRFGVETALNENIVIPQGTRATTDGSVYFATDHAAVLQAGSLSVDVPATCTDVGTVQNGIRKGTITTLVDLIPFVSAVTNTVDTHSGDDGETDTGGDDRYRERIREYGNLLSTAGPRAAYVALAMGANADVADVSVETDAKEDGTVNIAPLMVGGRLPTEDELAEVRRACSQEDAVPMLDKVVVKVPTAVPYAVEIKYYTTVREEAAAIDAIESSGGAIARYLAWQSGALGRDINPDQLRRFVLSPDWADGLTGAVRLDVVQPVFTQIQPDQVAQLSGTPKITHEVIT